MERMLYSKLVEWKDSPTRKPLMLYGARQVGKTYLLKEFGRNEFSETVYINCYKNPTMESLFKKDKDISRILIGLSAISGKEIKAGKTFIFLDEVQEIPEVVASLKYFCEDCREQHIAVAGSLLGVLNMGNTSFPTGKVDLMHLYPMTYMEFLLALGERKKADLLRGLPDWELVDSLSASFIELLRQYYFVGGMPEAVLRFVETKNPVTVREVQQTIIAAYEADIAKHAGNDTQKARMVLQSLPSQLARENKKFVFGALRKGARASEFENAIQWLVDAGIIYRVCKVTKPTLPLSFYFDKEAFKLFLLDVGLLGAMSMVPPATMLVSGNVFVEFKGAFTENYLLTQILPVNDTVTGYYSKSNSSLEIDFIVQAGNRILPIEVKAEENVKSKSLRQFVTVDNIGTGLRGFRFSMKGYADQGWMENIPLYAAGPFIEEIGREAEITQI